jgi:FkbM family methyltransferase
MRRLYTGFAGAGDLVFDIGAHAGNHVRSFLALGCHVVAVEPQPDFARLLRLFFARSSDVVVVEAAVSEVPGRALLSVSERTPTVTTLAPDWRDARAREPDFAHVRWNRRVEIDQTTLDRLIEQFGMPAFVKIDVEGSEPAALGGLTNPVRGLAFEYLPRALDAVEASAARLAELGHYTFNWSAGESYRLGAESWVDQRQLLDQLRTAKARQRSGDVYARLSDSSRGPL